MVESEKQLFACRIGFGGIFTLSLGRHSGRAKVGDEGAEESLSDEEEEYQEEVEEVEDEEIEVAAQWLVIVRADIAEDQALVLFVAALLVSVLV